MTKEEVRAISLDKLELHRGKRMLDVGSGTGSVTIQAARTYPELEVVAVERNPALWLPQCPSPSRPGSD